MKNFLYLIVIALLVGACSIEQEIRFNSDWSGNSKMVVNSTFLKDFGLDSAAENGNPLFQDSTILQTSEVLNSIEGISNVEIHDDENGALVASYDFSGVAALNESMNSAESTPTKSKEHDYFIIKGKTITYKMPPLGVDSTEMESFKMMSSMMKFKLTLMFSNQIKKLNTDNGAIIGEDKKSVIWEPPFASLVNGEVDPTIEVVLK